jgi:hypothetical protein
MKKQASRWSAVGVLVLALAGCSGYTRSQAVETTAESAPSTDGQTRRVVETEYYTDVEQREEGGLASGVINAIGNLLALPFRLLGGLIDLIF